MSFIIDKNVPPPVTRKGKYVEVYATANILEVEESFFVPSATVAELSSQLGILGRKNNKTFTIRTVQGGSRVWRIK